MAGRKKIAFLTGAGFAVDAGLPHSAALASKLKEYLVSLAAGPNNQEAKIQLSLLYFLLGGIRFQWGRLGSDPDQSINIEQIATAALRLRHRGSDPLSPYVASWSEKITEFEAAQQGVLEKFSEVIFARLRQWLTTPAADKIEYVNRIGDLHDKDTSVSIFSLNYDLIIESAFASTKRPLANGFKGGRWDPRLLRDHKRIRLFKLHGSLDWVDDEMHGICSLSFDRHPKAEDFEELKPPLLIFGTDAKLSGKDPFLTLTHSFSEELRVANLLVVIGYSFTDHHINEIIEQRMRENLPLRMIVVSPSSSRIKDSRAFLEKNPRVLPIDAEAKAALNDGLVKQTVIDLLRETAVEAPF